MASTGEVGYVLQAAAPEAASSTGKALNANNNNTYALPVAA
jgi:hypothetical protein